MTLLPAIKILLSLLVPCFLGYLLLIKVLRARPSALLASAAAYPIGISAITGALFLLGWARAPLFHVFIATILIAGYCVLTGLPRGEGPQQPSPRLTPGQFLILALILSFASFAFWQAAYFPVYAYDTLVVEAFKAKVFFYDQNFDKLPGIIHPSFPLQIPLIMTWANLCVAHWSERVPQLQFPMLFISLICLHLYILRHLAGKTWGLVGALALCASPLLMVHAAIPYRDLWMLYINSAATGFLLLWMKDGKKSSMLVLAAIFAGIGTSIKLEGVAYMLAFICTYIHVTRGSPTKTPALSLAKTLTILGLLTVPFILFKLSRGIPFNEKAVVDLSMNKLLYMPAAARKFLHEMFLSGNWSIIWTASVMAVIMEWKNAKQSPEIKMLAGTLGLYLAVHLLTVLLTNNAHDLLHEFTLSRLFMHFYFIPLWITVLLLKNKCFRT